MPKRQILALFVCGFVIRSTANGLIPLLPVYAKQLGADSAIAGYYLSFCYVAVAAGAISAGWISDKLGQRKIPIIIAGLVMMPLVFLMGRASNIWSLSVFTAVLWYAVGLSIALVGTLTGLSADESERGKIFGILGLTHGFGSLIGNLGIGFTIDRWGFPTLFTTLAGFITLLPISGLLLTEKFVDQTNERDDPVKEKPGLGKSFYLLFAASLIVATAYFVILLGRSLLMDDLEFSAFEISITGAVNGAVSIPLPLLLGWLSDRKGRKRFLYLGYLACIISLAILAVSVSLWHFVLVLALQAILAGVVMSVGNAFVTDLVPPESLGRGISLYDATGWIGGVLGFAGGGYALKVLGTDPTFILAMSLPLIAMVLLIPIRSRFRRVSKIASA
jgi:MFS family permease